MARAGIIYDEPRMELIDGLLIELPGNSPLDIDFAIGIGNWLFNALAKEFVVVPGSTLVLSAFDAPRPDWYVFPASLKTADVRGPNVLLAIEQSDSSLSRDLGEKAALYAQYGVRDYWVIDLEKRQVHVHRDLAPEGYGTKRRFEAHEPIEAALIPGLTLKLANLARVG